MFIGGRRCAARFLTTKLARMEPVIVTPQVSLRSGYELGEGSIYNAATNTFMHVDILGKTCALHNHITGEMKRFELPTVVGTIVPRASGGAVVALKDGPFHLNFETGQTSRIGLPLQEPPTNRCNDGKCGPDGRFYFGTMHSPSVSPRPPTGSLYVLDHDGSIRTLISGVTISNGLAWDKEGKTMYYIDTPTGAVQAFDFDAAKGAISNGRIAFRIPEGTGHPDGCTIDADGKLWVAQWGGSRVVRYDPATGAVLAILRLPTEHVSSVAFGGDDLTDMYVTTAKEFMTPEQLSAQPHAGDVFVVRNSDFKGVPAQAYLG